MYGDIGFLSDWGISRQGRISAFRKAVNVVNPVSFFILSVRGTIPIMHRRWVGSHGCSQGRGQNESELQQAVCVVS